MPRPRCRGAPVTTLDFDFLFRKTATTVRKLRALADRLGGVVFMVEIHGARSYESLRSRATVLVIGEARLLVADLSDIVRSKRMAGRPRDLAVLPILEATLDERRKSAKAKKPTRSASARKRT